MKGKAMDKRIRKSIMVIISMVLILVMLGVSFAWADTPNENDVPILSNADDLSGSRLIVTTEWDVNGAPGSNYYTNNSAGSTYGYIPTPSWAGHVFVGWFSHHLNEDQELTTGSIVPSTDHTVYAHWAVPENMWNYGAGKLLNIYGSNITYLYNGMNVTLWTASGSNEQKWLISALDNTIDVFFRSYVDEDYGLNVYRWGSPWNCTIHQVVGNETDAQVFLDWTSDGYKRWILTNYKLHLTAGGSSDGSNVYWDSFAYNTYQIWD